MDSVERLLESAQAQGVFPASAIEVGRRAGPAWQHAVGTLVRDRGGPPCRLDTVFDLASLTKVIATASIAMRLMTGERLDLDVPVADWLPEWAGTERSTVTARHLLDHSSGLPAHVPLWRSAATRAAFRAALLELPLERPVGVAAVYSDVGFLVLGAALEAVGARALDALFAPLVPDADVLDFCPSADLVPRIAPTEYDSTLGRYLRGEVHDENARALGGVAAHAGLFGTVTAVGAFARLVLDTFHELTPLGTPALMRAFARRSAVPGSSRALAWDTMLPTSSCGTRLSPTAIGHTGYTGTSLWIDWERDLYVAWLTNRVHPSRDDDRLVALRPRVHDAVVESLA